MLYQADRVVLQFASFRQTNLDLISLDLSRNSEHLGIEVSGTLGLPVLSMFQSVTIDYRDARINFDYKPR
jgi:ribosomal protein S10